MKKIILFLVLALGISAAFGQRSDNHTVYFKDIDGFSGYVKFKTLYEGFATQLKANSGEVVITGYDATNEEIVALNKAGLGLKRHTGSFRPSKFSFEVVGRAHIVTAAEHLALSDSKLTISESLGDYTTPSFNDATKKAAEAWGKSHKESYWERFGGFRGEKVTALYLTELKNEINRILGDYKRQQEGFTNAISNSIQQANVFSFDAAESYLNNAKSFSNDSNEHRSKISELEKLIAEKKKEQAEAEKKEAEEKREEQSRDEEAESKGASSSKKGNSSSESSTGSSSDDTKKSSSRPVDPSIRAATEGSMAEQRGDYTSALQSYRAAKNMGNITVTETKIRQMEFMSGVQQIGGVINYWAENARKQKEMRAAAERRAEEREAEAEANFRQRMLERDRLHLPVTDYETFSALKEATDKDLVPFVGSEFENDPQLKAEFERVRESLMYFYITDDGRLREATMDSGSKMMIIENKDEALGHSYALKFDESRQRKGQGYFILMSQELHSIMLKKPPYSGDLISGHRMRDGFYYNIDGYYQLDKGLKKRDIQSKLSQTHKDIVDFGNRTFMGKYAIGINTKTHKFHVLFNDFNTTRLRYEFTWKGINFRQPKGGNAYLFNTEVLSRKFIIDHNTNENQTGFFINQDDRRPITEQIGLHYLPYTSWFRELDGRYQIQHQTEATTLKRTPFKSDGYQYRDFDGEVRTGRAYLKYPWYFFKKSK